MSGQNYAGLTSRELPGILERWQPFPFVLRKSADIERSKNYEEKKKPVNRKSHKIPAPINFW
jgi:hypothetical protein